MNRKIIAIVPAAGIGSRAATTQPKQYQNINGQPMLYRAVSALLASPQIIQVRVAVASNDTYVANALKGLPRTIYRQCGGTTRANTVCNAIADAKAHGLKDTDWVLVHDAARPGLPAKYLQNLIDSCISFDTGGLLAMPVADSVKKSDNQSPNKLTYVGKSIDRSHLWLAQTPQMFKAGELEHALNKCLQQGINITDESSAMEYIGYKPIMVTGSMQNFKVTWPDDFKLISKLI